MSMARRALRLWWRFRLAFWMTRWRYTPTTWWNVVETWKWTGEECWAGMLFDVPRNERYSPMEALKEDWSYA
jgi:hypothetical protein